MKIQLTEDVPLSFCTGMPILLSLHSEKEKTIKNTIDYGFTMWYCWFAQRR